MAFSLIDPSRNVIFVICKSDNARDKVKVIKEGEMLMICAPVICINQNCQTTIAESSDIVVNSIIVQS